MKLFLIAFGGLCILFLIFKIASLYKKRRDLSRLRLSYGNLPDHDLRAEDIESIHESYAFLKSEDDIDEITWKDLDLETLYWQINNTQSTHGDEWLYAYLHKQRPDNADEVDALVHFMASNPDTRLDIMTHLNSIGKHTDHKTYEFFNDIDKVKTLPPILYISLSLALIIGVISIPFTGGATFSLVTVLGFLNLFVYYWKNPTRKYTQNLQLIAYSVGASSKLKYLQDLSDDHPVFKRIQAVIKITAPIARQIRLSTTTNTNSEYGFIFQGLDSFLLITPIFMSSALKLIKKHKDTFIELFSILGILDGTIAIASYKETLPYWCKPTLINDNNIHFDSLVHPLLIHEGGIANSATTQTKLIFTGSNASGKSTFIKALALNAHLGQTIRICTAKQFTYRPGHVYTSMALSDNIQAGKSYFIVELESLKRILDATQNHDHCILVVDEILRGTNTIERIAASSSILEAIKHAQALVCVATHDIELTQILQDSYENYHFRETITDSGITFDYILHDGPSTTTNAIKLLDYMNFNQDIITHSNQRVKDFIEKKTWIS